MNKKKTILGITDETTPTGKLRIEAQTAAEQAKANGDIDALFNVYEQAVYDRAESERSLLKAVSLSAGMDKSPMPDYPAIRAMRDVALAAIELAKSVALSNQPTQTKE